MLEGMSERNKKGDIAVGKRDTAELGKKMKIVLSDSEFGKY
jgi:hypothetical protein